RPARLVQVAQPGPEPVQLRLDLRRRLPVALAAARQPLEAHWLAPGDRDRREVAGLPVLRAVDRGADHRHVLLQRDHRSTRLDVPGNAAVLTGSLDEDAERVAVTHDLPHPPD